MYLHYYRKTQESKYKEPSLLSSESGDSKTRFIPSIYNCHLDYLRVVVKFNSMAGLEKFIQYVDSKYLVYEFNKPFSVARGIKTYQNRITSIKGIRGGFNISSSEEVCKGAAPIECLIDFSGEYFCEKSCVDQWRLIVGLANVFDARATRIDIAIDDYSGETQIPVEKMVEAWKEGNHFGFKNYKHIASGKCVEEMEVTNYFGCRDSGKMVRVYSHKNVMRFETEFKRGYAPAIFKLIASLERIWSLKNGSLSEGGVEYKLAVDELNSQAKRDVIDLIMGGLEEFGSLIKNGKLELENEIEYLDLNEEGRKDYYIKNKNNKEWEFILQRIMAALAIGGIDFRDKSSRKDRTKASKSDTKRLDFWQEFIDKIGAGIKLKIPKVESNISNTIDWLVRQGSKTLAIIKNALGGLGWLEFIAECINRGEKKFKVIDLKKIDFIKANKSVISLNRC